MIIFTNIKCMTFWSIGFFSFFFHLLLFTLIFIFSTFFPTNTSPIILPSCVPQAYPDRYIECFIAEQNLVGVAIGAACRNRTVPFVSTFAAFFTRTFDQVSHYLEWWKVNLHRKLLLYTWCSKTKLKTIPSGMAYKSTLWCYGKRRLFGKFIQLSQ